MQIAFSKFSVPESGTLVVGVFADGTLTPSAQEIDGRMSGALSKALVGSNRFNGKKNTTLTLNAPPALALGRVILVGFGKAEDIDELQMQAMGGRIVGALNKLGESQAAIVVDSLEGCPMSSTDMIAEAAFGAKLASYRFDKYRTKQKEEDKPTLANLTLMSPDSAAARASAEPRQRVLEHAVAIRRVGDRRQPERVGQESRGTGEDVRVHRAVVAPDVVACHVVDVAKSAARGKVAADRGLTYEIVVGYGPGDRDIGNGQVHLCCDRSDRNWI